MKLTNITSIVLFTLGGGSAVAQDCPDVGGITVEERLLAGPSTPCGVGLEITIGGVTYTSQQGFCPSFILIIPEHAVPAQKREGYFYRQAPPLPVTRVDYRCVGFFWTECEMSDPPFQPAPVQTYVDIPCFEIARPDTTASNL